MRHSNTIAAPDSNTVVSLLYCVLNTKKMYVLFLNRGNCTFDISNAEGYYQAEQQSFKFHAFVAP